MYVFIVLVACIFSRIFLSFSVSLVVTTYTRARYLLLFFSRFLSMRAFCCYCCCSCCCPAVILVCNYFFERPQAVPVVLCVPPDAPDLCVLLWVPPVETIPPPRVLLVGLARSSESESSELLPLPCFEEPTPLPRLLPPSVGFFGLFNTLAPRARPLPLEVAAVDALPVAAEGITFSESEESSMTILSGTFLLFVCVDVSAPRPLLFALVVAAAAAAALPLFFGTDFTSSKSL